MTSSVKCLLCIACLLVAIPGNNAQQVLEGGLPVPHLQDNTAVDRRQFHAPSVLDADGSSPGGNMLVRQPPPPLPRARLPVVSVALLTLAMAGASGIGAVPFFFVPSLSPYWAAVANGVACGFMLAASFDLLHEGEPYGGSLVSLGVLLGAVFIAASHQLLEAYEDVQFEDLRGAGARKTLLVVGVMAAHAFGEGCGVGVSYCGDKGWAQGLLVTVAIGVHNIPEGLAKATVMAAQGVPPHRSLWWSVVTCLPQPLVAVPSFLFVDTFRAVLPVALGFACGCMVWMVVSELLPDALKDAPPRHVATTVTFSAACLEAVRMAMDTLVLPDGQMASPLRAPVQLLLPMLVVAGVSCVPGALAGGLLWHAKPPTAVLLGGSGGALMTVGAAGLLRELVVVRRSALLLVLVLWAAGALAMRAAWHATMHTATGHSGVELTRLLQGAFPPALPKFVPHAGNGAQLARGHGSALVQRLAEPLAANCSDKTPMNGGAKGAQPSSVRLLSPEGQAAAFALAMLCLHALPEGWLLARSVAVTGIAASMLLLPCCCATLLRGAVAAGLLPVLLQGRPQRPWLQALGGACVGGMGPMLACALAAGYPFDGMAGDGARVGASSAVNKLAVVGSGALFAAGAWVVTPMSRAQQRPSARAGWFVGLLASLFMCGMQGLLCLTSSVCIGR